MGETLYSALGVAEDATRETIRRAYRERVKESHPDVTDDPSATRTFKRLTTARDVLTDETERDRYDRLGHDAYVSEHLGATLWEVHGAGSGTPADGRGDVPTGRERPAADGAGARVTPGDAHHRAPHTRSDDRTTWLGEDWSGPRQTARRGRASATSGGSWQMASEAYRTSPRTTPTEEPSHLARARGLAGAIGPWIVVHVAFVGSAIATGWFTWAQTDGLIQPTLPAVAAGVVLFVLVVTLSTLHIVSLIYS